MMLAWILMLAPPTTPAPSTADLRQLAEDHARAERFTLAGETYLQLARRPDVRPRDELYNAHTHFENAFLVGSGAEHLCRALRIAERVLADGAFNDEQEHIFWREVADFDLSQLADDARTSGRPNCRYDAAGHPRPPVLLLTDADIPPRPPPAAEYVQTAERLPAPTRLPVDERRQRARTAAGATLTGLGVGMLGSMVLALAGQRAHAGTMSAMIDQAQTRGRDFTLAEQTRFERLYDDARQLRSAALGLGIAGAATLTTGVALLSTRGRGHRRALAISPFGGPLGAGGTFRLEF